MNNEGEEFCLNCWNDKEHCTCASRRIKIAVVIVVFIVALSISSMEW